MDDSRLAVNKSIMDYIKTKQLAWFGHVQSMDDSRLAVNKSIMDYIKTNQLAWFDMFRGWMTVD